MDRGNYIALIEGLVEAIDPGIELWGNTSAEYIVTLVVFVVLSVFFWLIQFVILHRLAALAKRTETDIDDTFIKIVKSLKPGFYFFVAFFIATQLLMLPDVGQKIVTAVLLIWIAVQVVIALQILIDYFLTKRFADIDGDGTPDSIVLFMGRLVKSILWLVAGLMVFSNLGVNVTSLMAGLGIGGLAIAFALQTIFADLFASFAIYLDKPFKVGDFITVGEHMGVVKKIGIKTTRIQALQGEEVVISNQELTSARVQNFKQMQERRIQFMVGVTYDTPAEKLEKIPSIIENIITNISNTRFDRTHFQSFGDFALNFEIVYYTLSSDYNIYMDTQQAINLAIRDAFEEEGVEMAYPTQTIYLNKT